MKISDCFGGNERGSKTALIVYISCGDPGADETIKAAEEIISAGADILELGLPFSDPIADGTTIQVASQRALKAGMNTDLYFDTVKKIQGVPKVCMTYYNLLFQYGLDRFCERCVDSGINGLIIPDVPFEESTPLKIECDKHGIDLIFIVTSRTKPERIHEISKKCSGFLYLQSLLGVTGERSAMASNLKDAISECKKKSSLPVAVGFGVSTPEQVKELRSQGADGVIVGSAVIKKMHEDRAGLSSFIRDLKEATL